jgi:branched-chain amino acid transport system permease protein
VLAIVTLITLLCINLTRGNPGRMWKATRDMDIAAELIGINLMKSKLMAFAVSSYIVGVAGALFVFHVARRGRAQPVRHHAELPDPVHRDHRRARFDPWQLSRRDPDRRASGGPEHRCRNSLGVEIKSATLEHLNIMIVGSD